jgi:hypothetical protein
MNRTIPSDQRELNDLLELAERIQASYETAARVEVFLRLFEAVLLVGAVLSFVTILGNGDELRPSAGIGIMVACILYIVVVDSLLVQRYRRRTLRDRLALGQVVDLLRELERVSYIDEDWTALQRAEFRIRLSRFEIEEPPPPLSRLFRSR